MRQAAVRRLENRDPKAIARNAGVGYDEEKRAFLFETLGVPVKVAYPECEITPQFSDWHLLLILHYLDLADGTAPTGRLISFSQIRNGMVRGGGFDRKCEAAVMSLLACISQEEFRNRCLSLGGCVFESNADFSVRIPFLPRFEIVLKVWFADEDFGASARMLPDASADHYLTIEDAVTVGELILERLKEP